MPESKSYSKYKRICEYSYQLRQSIDLTTYTYATTVANLPQCSLMIFEHLSSPGTKSANNLVGISLMGEILWFVLIYSVKMSNP